MIEVDRFLSQLWQKCSYIESVRVTTIYVWFFYPWWRMDYPPLVNHSAFCSSFYVPSFHLLSDHLIQKLVDQECIVYCRCKSPVWWEAGGGKNWVVLYPLLGIYTIQASFQNLTFNIPHPTPEMPIKCCNILQKHDMGGQVLGWTKSFKDF